jgi:hypothetical protein
MVWKISSLDPAFNGKSTNRSNIGNDKTIDPIHRGVMSSIVYISGLNTPEKHRFSILLLKKTKFSKPGEAFHI